MLFYIISYRDIQLDSGVGEALLRLPSVSSKIQLSLCSHNLTFYCTIEPRGTYETIRIRDNPG